MLILVCLSYTGVRGFYSVCISVISITSATAFHASVVIFYLMQILGCVTNAGMHFLILGVLVLVSDDPVKT
jgi:hypothetical protein